MDIVGKKVTLKAIQEEDLKFLMDLFNDPRTGMTVGGWTPSVSYHQQLEWYSSIGKNSGVLRFAVWENHTGRLIGSCSIADIDTRSRTAEIHCRLSAENIGKGMGTDAAYQQLVVSFDYLDLACVTLKHLASNTVSQRVAERLGFVYEATLRSRAFKEGIRHDVAVHSILADEFAITKSRYRNGEL